MKKKMRYFEYIVSFWILFALSMNTVMGQTIIEKDIYSVSFTNENDSRLLKIWLPKDYEINKPSQIIYVFDANYFFDVVASLTDYYRASELIPSTLVAGVFYREYGDRTDVGCVPEKIILDESGESFYTYVIDEVMPILRGYTTENPYQIFFGWSYLADYSRFYMVNDSDFFDAYMLFAPTTDITASFNPAMIDKKIFISAGREDSPERVEYADNLYRTLIRSGVSADNIKILISNTDHNLIVPKTFCDGLDFIYKDYINGNNVFDNYIDSDNFDFNNILTSNYEKYRAGTDKTAMMLANIFGIVSAGSDFTDYFGLLSAFDNPDDANLIEIQGSIYKYLNDLDSAIYCFEKAIEICKSKNETYKTNNAYLNLYRIRWNNQRDFIKSLDVLDRAMTDNPRMVSLYYYKGVLLVENDRSIELAIELLNKYLELIDFDEFSMPEYNVYYYLALCHSKINNIEAAEMYLNKALEKDLGMNTD